MITKLEISNFKSHKHTFIHLGHLTVLTGINGCGKTSVIQSLLLLRQSFLKNRLALGLDLNQPLCNIGIADDALYQLAENGIISFVFSTDNNDKYTFEFDAEKGLNDSFIRKHKYNEAASQIEKLGSISLFNNDFQYISASRWGGRSIFPKESFAVEVQKQISQAEGQGELVAHFLYKYGSDNVLNYYDTDEQDLSLLAQVVYWEQKISPNVTINVEAGRDNNSFTIGYGFDGENEQTKPIRDLRAENIGFGISYTLPVIVAILSARPGALVIIENPEAHLHPQGQSELARLISKAASFGIQVIVETHSDHIINGIQIACKEHGENAEKGIDNHFVRVYSFYSKVKHISQIEEIVIKSDGLLELQPKGFFDQAENDMYKLYNS
ncbi:DUF3696 domain-containing protein [Phocaeicola barnesiae]|uniref:DUF3696 domain-containing protein n=1 Tax=Phocaeicola barnesiae TaxID=376804 RepID=UPI00266EA6E1|nr:DUF3696 domain-containing protein [Phocaeicola barnesiae]